MIAPEVSLSASPTLTRRRRRQAGSATGAGPEWEAPKASKPGHQRYALVIFQLSGFRSSQEPRGLDADLFRRLRRLLRDKICTTRNLTEIDVWLDSPGGDADSAYKIALLLRSYAAALRVVVPDRAKGAASLLALAADEIYLAPAAELGPLDTRIDAEPGGAGLSALDVVKSADHISRTALTFALNGASAVLGGSDLSRRDALDVAVRLSAQLFQSSAQRLHPARFLQAQNLLDATIKYADAVASMRNPEILDAECGPLDLEALAREYPHRGFVIDIDEARELGLPVQPLWKYPAADTVQALHEQVEEQGGTQVDVRRSEIDIRSAGGKPDHVDRLPVRDEATGVQPILPTAGQAPAVRPDAPVVSQALGWKRDLDPSEDPANW